MKEKIIKVDDQREIIVLDDAYNYAEISGFYKSAIKMHYQIYNLVCRVSTSGRS